MYKLIPLSEKALREDLLDLAEELQEDILLLECLAQADLSDCCGPEELEPLHRRITDYIRQHGRDIGRLTEKLS